MSIGKRVLYEDNHLLIVNKLPGELVQGDNTGDEPLLEKVKTYIGQKYDKPGEVFCGLVHRLDRPTSGLVIFARTSKALARMNKLFEERQIEKKYFALVKAQPSAKSAELTNFLSRNRKKNKSFVVAKNRAGAKEARLSYTWVGSADNYHLLKIDLHTGRHHQIRAQLAHQNMPIKGDLKYGFPRSNEDASISLHAGYISFEHPVKGKLISLNAPHPKPDAVWKYFADKLI